MPGPERNGMHRKRKAGQERHGAASSGSDGIGQDRNGRMGMAKKGMAGIGRDRNGWAGKAWRGKERNGSDWPGSG